MTQDNFADGTEFSAEGLDSVVNAINHEAILSGGVPSVGTGNFDVDLTACDFVVGGTDYTASADTVTLSNPSASDRVDIITATTTPGFSATQGTAATNPNAPDIPNNEVLICAVYVASDATNLQTSDIHDYRAIVTRDATTYKTNDIDTDGDGKVNDADAADLADDSNQLGGIAAAEYNTFDTTSVSATVAEQDSAQIDTGVPMGNVVAWHINGGTRKVNYHEVGAGGDFDSVKTYENGTGNFEVELFNANTSASVTVVVLHT